MTRKKEDKIPKPDGKLEKPVILIGMMGAGKSSIGKMLAAHIGAHFIDSDTEIEKAAKMTIPEIFKLHGEAYFRDGEKRVFKRLLEGQPAIIAAGGAPLHIPQLARLFWSPAFQSGSRSTAKRLSDGSAKDLKNAPYWQKAISNKPSPD